MVWELCAGQNDEVVSSPPGGEHDVVASSWLGGEDRDEVS